MTPQELRDLVGVMRELGVVEACGIVLGPAPHTGEPRKREELTEEQRAERRDAILFAASGVRPR